MTKMKNLTIPFVLSLLLISSIFAAPASAAVAGANLKVTIIEINPYPAQIGQYMDLTIQVENVGRDRADDVSIEVVPEYPFSLDSPTNAVQNVGALAPEKVASKEFHLFVDKNAQKGVRSIDIRTQADRDSPWSKETFDIRVGTETFDSKGTVELAEIVSDPGVFMPGDRGTVTVTLKNTATAPTVTIDGEDFDTNARIQAATLVPLTDGITVTGVPFSEMGLLGPGDSIDLTFNVEVSEEVRDGTYNLELALEGNSFDYNSRKNIPLDVDSSNVKVIPSKPLKLVNGEATLEFDVANTHPNEFSSVSIRPEAEGVEFYPLEYFIGPMDPDELFTIEFDAVTDVPAGENGDALEPINLTLSASYSNGINKHENLVSNLPLRNVVETQGSSSTSIIVAVMLVVLVAAGVLIYRKKKQSK
ncbi:LPXTG cell wall anchor domain-containing protein [Methanosarcina sp. KYL-1]|uniref:COG1361 S-layer family protein n=1 Tax=Methanosarcina sp. KYL-1 TaxID=2602068 RepID=UPI0021008DA7|nr:COG1361 S-layer family protein [Methanosarcina sp. KYL-1]MCQ1534207.1 LPXTG cell wall anchor domain-containing protein [Methanosarcina sp. KYL-1]